MTAARALLGIVLAASLAAGAGRAGARSETGAAQALRTCVDRWNQANMLDWGPAEASVAVRRLHPGELQYLAQLARPGCVVALAVEFPKDPRQGCYGGKTVPGQPHLCIDRRTTNICAPTSPRTGAYYCTTRSDGAPALANRNATTDGRGS